MSLLDDNQRLKEVIVNQSMYLGLILSLILVGCGQKKDQAGEKAASPKKTAAPVKAEEAPQPLKDKKKGIPEGKSLLITLSKFKKDDKGKYTVPDKGALIILQKAGDNWNAEQIEDTDSNVLHKALPGDDKSILTIGGNQAMLKRWQKKGSGWQGKILWNPTFGGKHNRLRDFELGDFDKDGKKDLAIATHDQGVVAVVWNRGEKWEPEELDRKPNIFVHEIEIGDLDQDGSLEIYATPSEPNTVSGKDQGGKVVQFTYNRGKFTKKEVVSLESRHVKEIMVKDVDGDGRDEIYAALEAEVDGHTIKKPVEIRRFDLKDGKFEASEVIKIDDRFCRFLVAGDLDGDGANELVAAAFSTGVWIIKKTGDTYTKTCINATSGGFEHAAYIADLDGDGKKELYVADDRSGAIHRYVYEDGIYEKETIYSREVPSAAMVWNITDADL
jgi:hypothetical protein